MNCLTARKILFVSESINQIPGNEHLAARQHVTQCRECRQFFAQDSQFRALVRAKLAATSAPPHLREKILSSVAKERRKSGVGKISILGNRASLIGTAAIVGLLILVYSLFSPPLLYHSTDRMEPTVSALIQDHIAGKLKEHPLDIETSDRAQLERWFAARVDFNVVIPRLGNTELTGGRLCLISGKRVVSLCFQQDGVPVTLYIVDRTVVDVKRMNAIASVNNRPVYHADAKGCTIVLWEERGLVYSLVSDMSEQDLVKLISQSS